ncbi:HAD hydrolase family protein [Paenibacillus cremeus]|uniref:HAD family phosphatase n=1 Tax=Paenibacillus cremeus TaxID=2163881 RepID=A0A559K4I0_9BACL|nr:HAD hydrolase family protein [Paenibacillus cremeus]TVY07000.1 hypothetical protein FPZ49_26575 [Paenibacillus cremeus]
MICYNGAAVRFESGGEFESFPLECGIVDEMYDFIVSRQAECFVTFEIDDQLYCDRPLSREQLQLWGLPEHAPMPGVVPRHALQKRLVSKMLLRNERNIFSELQAVFGNRVHAIVTDRDALIQIMNKTTSKEAAVQRVLERTGGTMERVMAFGDDWNDYGLFAACGYPIALENSLEELKGLAWRVTASNNKDGVAEVLEQVNAVKRDSSVAG